VVYTGTTVPECKYILEKIQKILTSKRKISLDKNTRTLFKIIRLWKLMFSGYAISYPEIKRLLHKPVVDSLTLGIAKITLQVLRSV
jgi:hypothetical protein